MTRPEVSWKRVRGGRAWHIFKDGAAEPVCGTSTDSEWIIGGSLRMHVHKQCWQLCPWRPRINRMMSEAEIASEELV